MKMKDSHWTKIWTPVGASVLNVSAPLWSKLRMLEVTTVSEAIEDGTFNVVDVVELNRAYDEYFRLDPVPCLVCGKILTVRQSIERGFGPICAG